MVGVVPVIAVPLQPFCVFRVTLHFPRIHIRVVSWPRHPIYAEASLPSLCRVVLLRQPQEFPLFVPVGGQTVGEDLFDGDDFFLRRYDSF